MTSASLLKPLFTYPLYRNSKSSTSSPSPITLMAEAYSAVERVHPPLSNPLIDMNPRIAHKKLYWASSFRKIQEDMLANKDYSIVKPPPRKRDADDLVVLNIYTTVGTNPGWGLGPSPLSPLYLHYSALHPADFNLPKPPVPLASSVGQVLQAISDNYTRAPPPPTPPRPCMLQYFLDRKDFVTRENITTTCVRFLDDFAEWRLLDGPAENAGDGDVALVGSLRYKLGLKVCPENSGRRGLDTLAARIHVSPIVRTVDPDPENPIMNLFTSTPDKNISTPIYINDNEVEGEPGVQLYYMRSTDRLRRYWWIWEGSSWMCVYDPNGRTEWRSGWDSSRENAARKREQEQVEAQGSASTGVADGRPPPNKKFEELDCTIIKLYNSGHDEPTAAIELGAGQMWVQKTIILETIDVIVAVIFSIINMERAIRDERAVKSARCTNFIKRHFSA